MTLGRARTGTGFLLAVLALALVAPWLGLRDPAAQPDGLVLRYLPPLSRVTTIRLADGSVRYASEVRELQGGGVAYRRGESWTEIGPKGLAAGSWRGRAFYLLGADGFGRDLLSRLIHGARVSLLVGFAAALGAVAVGSLVGLLSGLAGGWVDGLLMRVTDLFLAVPRLFFLVLLVALYRPSVGMAIAVIAATSWMAAARLARGEILSLRERDWVGSARAAGASPWRLAFWHLLPGAAPPLLVETALRVGQSILLEASLSFLGLGVPPPTPSWGSLIADGRDRLLDAWWIATIPGLCVAATVVAVHQVGEAVRERLRPMA